jgi:peptide/nickel transport system substrate-binding protein
VDEFTVDILTQRLDISVLYSANYLFVLPKKYYEQVGKDTFANKPIGTGPYELAEYQPERLHVYKLRSTAHPFRKPKLQEVRWQNVPDSSASTTGLRTGDLDLLIGAFTPDQADKMKSDGMQIVVAVSTNAMLSIDKNTTERLNSPLTDKRVRLALNYAIDKEAIGRTVYKGFSRPIGQLSIPGALMYDESLKPIPFDQAMARRLLAEAGYPNGFKLVEGVDYATTYSGAQAMLLVVQDYWKQIGVETSINQVEIGTYLDKLFGRGGRTRPEVVINSSGDANGMAALARTFFLCSIPPEARIICIPEFDRNLNLAYAEVDAEKRRGYMQAANRAFVAEMPAIFLLVNPIFRFAGPKVRDVIIDNSTFYNLDTVYMVE